MYLVTNHGTGVAWPVADYSDARAIARDQTHQEGGRWHWDAVRLCWWARGRQPITIKLRKEP